MSAKVPIRPAVADLPAYVPGARSAGFGTYKASSNESPFSPLPGVLAAVSDAAADLNRYPSLGATRLCTTLAERFDLEPAQVVAGNGSVALLAHIVQAFCEPGDEVVYAWRSFEAYPIVVHLAGAIARPVPLTVDARHDLGAMARAVRSQTRIVLLCSPNNPTGPVIRQEELEIFLGEVPSNVLVVLDEAYVEFVDDPWAANGLEYLADHPNLVLLRTFSKAYGLAGLRVGYALARPRIAGAIRTVATPFGVSGVAEAAAIVSLGLEDALMDRVGQLNARRAQLVAELRAQGWTLPAAQGNFVWLPLGTDALAFAQAAAEAGVTVRPFDRDGVRISIAEPAALKILTRLTSSWVR